MNANPAAPSLTELAPGFAARFAVIAAALVALIARAFLRHPSLAPLIVPLCRRIARSAWRLTTLMKQISAGEFPSPRIRPGRPSRRTTAEYAIPTRQAWLVRTLHHEAAAYASQLTHLLAEPGISELLDRAPAARRLLRPICRMLGVPATALGVVASPDTPLCGVARQATRRQGLNFESRKLKGPPSRPESVFVPSRPPRATNPPSCPRLRLRWPWNAIADPEPA